MAATPSARAAGETVTITTQFGGDFDAWDFTNASGTPTDGYTVRIAAFSQSQSEVLSLSYNRAWINNQMQEFGSNVTATEGGFPGSFNYEIANNNDFFKGKQAWLVYSDGATLTSASNFGIVSSSDSSYTIASANPWSTTLQGQFLRNSQGGVVGFGSVTFTDASTGTIRVAATPTALYWDSNGATGGFGGTGTWNATNTVWTTDTDGTFTANAGSGPYAWGTTSSGIFEAGAGLTAHFTGTAGTVTVDGTVQAHNGLNFDPTSGSYTLSSGTINLAGGSAGANTITVATGDTATISSVLTGSTGMTKAASGTLTLSGANTYTGSTTVSAGTLQANAANALGSTTAITVNSGGSLLISANNAVNDSAGLTLNSGTTTAGLVLSGNNRSDVMGTLTLSSNSVIDMGSGTGNVWLSFNNLAAVLSSTTQLNIWNYEFGVDHIYFHGSTTNIGNATSLANVNFYSGAGTGFLSNGFLSGGELHSAVVPEPEVYATALLLLLGLGIHFYRQRRAQALPVAA